MRDAGKLLSDNQEKASDIATWREIFACYIRIQKEAVEHCDHLLQHGCPDRRLDKLPALFAEAIADTGMLHVGKKGGMTAEQYARLRSMLPQITSMCDELASYGIPETLHHDDLHGGNIMLQGERYIFFDWAESYIGHPFYSLAVILRYMSDTDDFDAEQLVLLSDTYLQAWTNYAPIERLRAAFQKAQQLGTFSHGLTWYYYTQQLEPDVRKKYDGEWPYWLRLFLEMVD